MTTQAEAIEALIKLSRDSTAGTAVRCAAAEGLGYVGGSEARTELLKLMTTHNAGTDIRSAAARALGHAAKS
ncbi:HEAT repeat domain-containing protein [Duganella sp. BuS-21]|uniref:HEAT repeat domain-containing protein n=1 Tax=Duganella sp. BuS-21 TaxID=2943848 RepID=UPI0035A5D6AB